MRECPPPAITGKVVEVINEGEDVKEYGHGPENSDEDGNFTAPAAWLELERDLSEDEEDEPQSENCEGDNNKGLVWGQFKDTCKVSTWVCTIVPLEDEVLVCAMVVAPKGEDDELIHNLASLHSPSPVDGPPTCIPDDQRPLMGYFQVGGPLTHVMFDLGSGTNMVLPEFS